MKRKLVGWWMKRNEHLVIELLCSVLGRDRGRAVRRPRAPRGAGPGNRRTYMVSTAA